MGELAYALVCLVPGALSIWKKAQRDDKLAPFVLFLVFSFITELTFIFTSLLKLNNHWLVNCWILFEVSTLGYLFLKWSEEKYEKIMISASVILFWLVWGYQLINFGIGQMRSLTLIPDHVFVFIFAGIYLIKFIKKTNQLPFKVPQFWIAAGLFIYYGASLIIYSSVDLFYAEKKPSWLDEFYFNLTQIFNYLSYIFYTTAFVCYSTKKNYGR